MQAPTPAPLPALSGLHPSAWLVEIEVLGPLTTLSPGASDRLAIDWVLS